MTGLRPGFSVRIARVRIGSCAGEVTLDGIQLSVEEFERCLEVLHPGRQPPVENERHQSSGNGGPYGGWKKLRDADVEPLQDSGDQPDDEREEFGDLVH